MRRKEFLTEKAEELETFLADMSFGFLGTAGTDGAPGVTPLNFVYWNGAIYFHGSRIGEKMDRIAADPRVAFAVAKEYAVIPSYFSDPFLACPATAYFKSVLIRGTARPVEDIGEKAGALEALMRKLQPEGGYRPIAADDPEYRKRLAGVAVVKIEIESITGKFKFGQNASGKTRGAIADGLRRRGRELDDETVRLMERYCPHHRQADH